MKYLKNKKNNGFKAYSLLEITVSLGIMAIATVLMMNFLVISLRLSSVSIARSFVREELSNLTVLISKDFRSSELPPVCEFTVDSKCILTIDSKKIRWGLCNENQVCKDELNSVTGEYQNMFTTSDNILINYFRFESGFGEVETPTGGVVSSNSIVLTVSAGYNSNIGVDNVIRQSSFSLRNYKLN